MPTSSSHCPLRIPSQHAPVRTSKRWKQMSIYLTEHHYNDVIMGAVASQITSVSIVCPTVGSCADQRKHQSCASLAFVRGIHRWPVNSPHKRPVTRKMFPIDDVNMRYDTITVNGTEIIEVSFISCVEISLSHVSSRSVLIASSKTTKYEKWSGEILNIHATDELWNKSTMLQCEKKK